MLGNKSELPESAALRISSDIQSQVQITGTLLRLEEDCIEVELRQAALSRIPHIEKAPDHARASCCIERVAHALRRRLTPRPTRPRLKSASVPPWSQPFTGAP
jgi:hypothetical protein